MPLAPNQQLFEYCIVRILGRGTFGTVYLVMEYLAGGSLRTLLEERGPLLPTPYSPNSPARVEYVNDYEANRRDQ